MVEPTLELIDVFVPQVRDGQPCYYRSAPGITVTKNGVVLAVNQERVGTIGDQFNQKNTVLRRSTDAGKTWLPMQVISPGEPGFSHG